MLRWFPLDKMWYNAPLNSMPIEKSLSNVNISTSSRFSCFQSRLYPCTRFFQMPGADPLVFSVHLVFNQPAVKPPGLDRFFP